MHMRPKHESYENPLDTERTSVFLLVHSPVHIAQSCCCAEYPHPVQASGTALHQLMHETSP
jgi:hypothetical protein